MGQLEGAVVVLGAVALMLVGPLRGALGGYPLLLFGSALYLFVVPGMLICRWIMGERHWGVGALVPLSFVISIGLFGLLGVPLLILHLSLDVYLWMAGAITVAFLVAAILRTLRPRAPTVDEAPAGSSSWWL